MNNFGCCNNFFFLPDKKSSCNKSFPSLATCWGILLLIMVLRFYFSTVLEKQIENLTEETQMLKMKNGDREEKPNRNNTTSWSDFNVSRAQWSIDAYCPKENNNRKCEPCQAEKKTVNGNSWKYDENKGYWIGLRVEDGIWKWLDGRDMTNSSWIDLLSPSDGHCAISVQDEGFKSLSCNEKNRWICNKKALSV
uniref:C-type lectin domain-containing protein n=1 Tax=Maylandia zebra TaxID=106582 RepID=A0A3P9BS18_9CICH